MKKIEWQDVLQKNQRKACRAMFDLGGAYRVNGEFSEAEACFREAEILATKAQDKELCIEAILWIGNLYYHSGRFHEALTIFQRLLPMYKRMGIDDSGLRSYHMRKTLLAMGDYLGALEQTSAALASLSSSAPLHRKCSLLSRNLEALLQNGLLAEAWKVVKKLLNLQRKDLDSPYRYIEVWLALAQGYLEFGKLDESKHFCLRALAVSEIQGHVPHQVTSLSLLVHTLRRQNSRRAIENLKIAEDRLSNYREDVTPHIRVKIALGQILLETGNPQEAKEQAKAAMNLLNRHNRFPELLDCVILEAMCDMLLSNWSGASEFLTLAEQYEKTIRLKNASLSVPLASAQMWRKRGDKRLLNSALDVASERYKALAEGLPKHVCSTFRHSDIHQLLEMGAVL